MHAAHTTLVDVISVEGVLVLTIHVRQAKGEGAFTPMLVLVLVLVLRLLHPSAA